MADGAVNFCGGHSKPLMLLAIAGSQWETCWFEVKYQTQTSTKIPLESSHQGLYIGVIQIWWFLCQIIRLTLAAHGLEELFSSCAVVSVFGSGGK